MPQTYKQLFGVALPATTLTTLYTGPASTQTIVASLSVCNRGATTATFRVSHALAGAVDAPGQYVYYDARLEPYSTMVCTIGACISATDVLRGYASTANLTMMAWGQENT